MEYFCKVDPDETMQFWSAAESVDVVIKLAVYMYSGGHIGVISSTIYDCSVIRSGFKLI